LRGSLSQSFLTESGTGSFHSVDPFITALCHRNSTPDSASSPCIRKRGVAGRGWWGWVAPKRIPFFSLDATGTFTSAADLLSVVKVASPNREARLHSLLCGDALGHAR